MLLTIDIGNTNVALGLFDGRTLAQHWRTATHLHTTSDECAVALSSLFSLAELDATSIDAAVIACVVPALSSKSEGCTVGGDAMDASMGMDSGQPEEPADAG